MDTLGSWINSDELEKLVGKLSAERKNSEPGRGITEPPLRGAAAETGGEALEHEFSIHPDPSLIRTLESEDDDGPVVVPVAPADTRLGEKLAAIRAKAERGGLLKRRDAENSEDHDEDPSSLIPIPIPEPDADAPSLDLDLVQRTRAPFAPVEPRSIDTGKALPPRNVEVLRSQTSDADAGACAAPSRSGEFAAPSLPMIPRLHAFRDWVERKIESAEVLVLDSAGASVLSAASSQDRRIRVAMVLGETHKRLRGLAGIPDTPVECRLGDGRRIAVMIVPSHYGDFVLAVVGEETLTLTSCKTLCRGLAAALNGAE